LSSRPEVYPNFVNDSDTVICNICLATMQISSSASMRASRISTYCCRKELPISP